MPTNRRSEWMNRDHWRERLLALGRDSRHRSRMMRSAILFVAVLGCGSGSGNGAATPTVTPYTKDLQLACGSEGLAHTDSLPAFGGFLETRVVSAEMKQLLADVKGGTLEVNAFVERLRTDALAGGVPSCPSADRLASKR